MRSKHTLALFTAFIWLNNIVPVSAERPRPVPYPPGLVAFMRFYNGHEHFYTADMDEALGVQNKLNYGYEGVTGLCFRRQPATPRTVPLFRLLNRKLGTHFYTTDAVEMQNATRNGWNFEKVACFVPAERQIFQFDAWQCVHTRSLYRLYNRIDHYYTMSHGEMESAQRVGYRFEKIAAYMYPQENPGCRGNLEGDVELR